MLSWQPPGIDIQRILVHFLRNLRKFIPMNFRIGIPTQWGGFGIGRSPPETIPKWYWKLINTRETGDMEAQVEADHIL